MISEDMQVNIYVVDSEDGGFKILLKTSMGKTLEGEEMNVTITEIAKTPIREIADNIVLILNNCFMVVLRDAKHLIKESEPNNETN